MTSDLDNSIKELDNNLKHLIRDEYEHYLNIKYGKSVIILRKVWFGCCCAFRNTITLLISRSSMSNKIWTIIKRIQPIVLIFLSFCYLTGLVSSSELNNKIIGFARVIDGDTLVIVDKRIRLHGIDAPEQKQFCTRDGNSWPCGREATDALRTVTSGNTIECRVGKRDRYKRSIAVCYLGEVDLNAYMVKAGWALAYRRYSTDYLEQEKYARERASGIWEGEFTLPWDWRSR